MGRIKFGVYKTPVGNGKKQNPCARLISRGTKEMDEVCSTVGECCSINSADLKGALEALTKYIGRELSNGYSVELDGLGHFSPALRSIRMEDKQGRAVYGARVHGVNFRCSNRLKELVKQNRPQKVKRENVPTADQPGRKNELMEYLETHPSINITEYATINKCSHYIAKNDLKLFVTEGIIQTSGYRTHRVYMLAGEEKLPEDLK